MNWSSLTRRIFLMDLLEMDLDLPNDPTVNVLVFIFCILLVIIVFTPLKEWLQRSNVKDLDFSQSDTIWTANNATQFDRVTAEHKYSVILFHTQWSKPSQDVAQLFAWLADEYSLPNYLAFIRVNIDRGADVHARYEVTEVPTFLFFEGGQPTHVRFPSRYVSAASKGVKLVQGRGVERIFGSTEVVALLETVQALGEMAARAEEADYRAEATRAVYLQPRSSPAAPVRGLQQRPAAQSPAPKSPALQSPFLQSPALKSPAMQSPFLQSPALKSPVMRSAFPRSPALQSPALKSPGLQSPFLQSPIKQSPWEPAPAFSLGKAPKSAQKTHYTRSSAKYAKPAMQSYTSTSKIDANKTILNDDSEDDYSDDDY